MQVMAWIRQHYIFPLEIPRPPTVGAVRVTRRDADWFLDPTKICFMDDVYERWTGTEWERFYPYVV